MRQTNRGVKTFAKYGRVQFLHQWTPFHRKVGSFRIFKSIMSKFSVSGKCKPIILFKISETCFSHLMWIQYYCTFVTILFIYIYLLVTLLGLARVLQKFFFLLNCWKIKTKYIILKMFQMEMHVRSNKNLLLPWIFDRKTLQSSFLLGSVSKIFGDR